MNKTLSGIIFTLLFVLSASFVSAQEVCEYGGIKTTFGTLHYEPGVKSEYADEKFVHIVDPKAITDLMQLKGLVCLEHADFYNQGISGNLENLNGLANLKVLSLHTNPEVKGDICDLSKAVKLKSLKFAFDEQVYGDISCLKNINLETFAMTYTNISGDLSDFSHMTSLKALYLSGTNIQGDVSSLSSLINLEELTLSNAEMDGSRFYGDLASLDSLKKLRKVAIYNTNTINCDHFHEMHPDIEGGCSDESKSSVVDPNKESEMMIGKSSIDVKGADEQKGTPPQECMVNGNFIGEDKCKALVDNGKGHIDEQNDEPPEQCIVNGKFIGEDKCRALVDKTSSIKSLSDGPPKECMVDGKFIGDDECRAMMEKALQTQPEKTEPQEPAVKTGFLQKLIYWFVSLFE